MRKILMAAAVVTGVGICTGAFAADFATTAPKATAYLNFGFGSSGKNSDILSNLHYGLRMDQVNPYGIQSTSQPLRPAFVQADFNLHDGFSGAAVNGVQFASHIRKLNEDGEETSYSLLDWGLLAAGAAGLGFGIAEVVKTHNDPDPKTTSTTGSGSSNPVVGAACTLLGGVLGTIGLGGVCTANTLTNNSFNAFEKADYERINWLDAGTGHMGDLNTVR